MSIKGNEENKNSFVKTISWWLILVPALIGVRFLIVYGLKPSPPTNSNSGFVKDEAVVAKEQSSEPAAPPTGAEMAAHEWMQGVGKIWCNTPNNPPKGIVKSLEDASFEFVSTPEGLRFVEEKAGKLEEYIRATSQAKSNIALNKILNEICPQKLTAFTRQRVRQLREEGIDKIRIDLYCLGEISNCSLIITLFIFLYSTIERIVRQRVRACSTERQPKSKHRQCCSNGKSPARHWIDFSPLMMPHPHPGHHPAWSYQVGNR